MGGCSCSASGLHFGCSSVAIKLQLNLHGATLSCCFQMDAQLSSPGPEALTRPYLEDLRRFFLTAMSAEKACCEHSDRNAEDVHKVPAAVTSLASPALDASAASALASISLTQATSTAS